MYRIGFGYDVHRLVAGRPLRLGGILIPYELGLAGHSDADVLLHAITDALLGAAGLGDIGTHFPPGDPAYKDADSRVLLRIAADRVVAAGWAISNIDSTVVAEQPKLAPHIPAIRTSIAGGLDLREDQVSVKAKTTEGLGFTGTGEGMAAYAVALLVREGEGG
jgi:2-C-methyl-D-erythritol 2,4-cyclodiphosphate synthase